VTATYIQEADFDQLLTSPELVVIDCTATWCGPCKLIAPLIDQLAVEYEGRAKVVKLDIDANKALSKRLGIRSIPNVFIFKQGEQVESIVGKAAYEVFSSAVEKHL
jgi:thioredoxin 1